MLPQFDHHALIVPATGADEILYGLALPTGLVGDGFGGLAVQIAEFAVQHDARQLVLLDPVEAGQVALQEVLHVAPANHYLGCRNLGVGKQRLCTRVVEQGHPCPS